jgi:uncharacterized damage-inducible protein DinB
MSRISRRGLVQSSVAAALALCVPEVWGQGRGLGHIAGQTPRPSGNFLAEFADEVRLSHAYTVECAEAMPEAKYFFRPVPEVRTFGQQMVHIGESVRGLYEVFLEGKNSPSGTLSEAGQELVRSKADVLLGLRDSFDYVEKAAARLNDANLETRVAFLNNREFSHRRVLHFILDHATHHRGQCIVYMRINGVRPPQYRA